MVPSIEGKSRGRSSSSSVYLFQSAFAAGIGGAAAAPLYPSTASAVFNPLRTVVARRSTRRDPLIADDVPRWDWGSGAVRALGCRSPANSGIVPQGAVGHPTHPGVPGLPPQGETGPPAPIAPESVLRAKGLDRVP